LEKTVFAAAQKFYETLDAIEARGALQVGT